jgi:hypothetical protein
MTRMPYSLTSSYALYVPLKLAIFSASIMPFASALFSEDVGKGQVNLKRSC